MAIDKEMLPLLSAYHDGELGPADRARVERALEESAELRTRLEDMDALTISLRATLAERSEELRAGFADRVMARLDARQPPLWERVKVSLSELFAFRRLQLAMGAGAAAMLVALGTVAVRYATVPDDDDIGALAEMPRIDDVTTPDDVDAMLVPDDGTMVIYVE